MITRKTRIAAGTVVVVCVAGMIAQAQPAPPPGENTETPQADPPSRVARLSYLTGSVSFQPAGVDDWNAATPNRPVTTGDRLWSDDGGRAELEIGTAAIRLNGHTGFSFLNLNDTTTQIQLTEGTIEVRVRELQPNEAFEVDTPNLAFSLLRPGEYRVDVDPAGATTILTVYEGEGEGTGGGQTFPLHPRQQARVSGTDALQYDLTGAPFPDAFVAWCQERDRRAAASVSARYVAPQTIGYEDLDTYGGWREEPEYGAVWFPRGVAVGWAPYRYGHWAWIFPWGWTWVDDAPWGFAPFHYGRWAVFGGAWGWVPGPRFARPVYAPALVAWVGGAHWGVSIGIGAGVGWFPLGPREVYSPYYHASAHYWNRVNVSNTVVTNVMVNNYYAHRTVIEQARFVNRGSMTAVPVGAMGNGRPVYQSAIHVREEEIRSARIAAAPGVAPTRQAVMGRIAASPVRRPPEAVMNRTVVARTAPPARRAFDPTMERGMRANTGERPPVRMAPGVRGEPNRGFGRPNVESGGGFSRPVQPREMQPRPAAPERQVERRAPSESPRPQVARPSEGPRPQVARPSEGPRPQRTERPQHERQHQENRGEREHRRDQ